MDEKTDLAGKQDGVGTSIQEVGASGISDAGDLLEEEPIEVLEASNIRALLLIKQYTSLRSEIEKRIDNRQQILTLTLLAAGTFLTVGVQPNVVGTAVWVAANSFLERWRYLSCFPTVPPYLGNGLFVILFPTCGFTMKDAFTRLWIKVTQQPT